jgi:histidine triad (HIT) family protein
MDTSASSCIFCRIAEKETRAGILYDDSDIVAFEDKNPQAPTHVLLIPKKHITSVNELTERDAGIVGKIFLTARKIAQDRKLERGYRIVTNTGALAGQSVFHLHFHLLGGRRFGWPPG